MRDTDKVLMDPASFKLLFSFGGKRDCPHKIYLGRLALGYEPKSMLPCKLHGIAGRPHTTEKLGEVMILTVRASFFIDKR